MEKEMRNKLLLLLSAFLGVTFFFAKEYSDGIVAWVLQITGMYLVILTGIHVSRALEK